MRIPPGETVPTRTPCGASRPAGPLPYVRRVALAAAQAGVPSHSGIRAWIDAPCTIAPRPAAAIAGTLVAMAAWRNARLASEERASILVGAETGREVEPAVIDPGTGLPVTDPRFVFTAGPAAGDEMRARYPGSA